MLNNATTAAMATDTPTTVSAVRTRRRNRLRSTKSTKCIGKGLPLRITQVEANHKVNDFDRSLSREVFAFLGPIVPQIASVVRVRETQSAAPNAAESQPAARIRVIRFASRVI